MLKKIAMTVALIGVVAGCTSTEYVPPTQFVFATTAYPRTSSNGMDYRWYSYFESMCREASVAKDCKVVFLGDSITDFWRNRGKKVWDDHFSKYQPLNFGIGGDRTENVLWRLQNGQLQETLKPEAFVLMIGTNNLGHRNEAAGAVADGIMAIVDELQKQRPEARILLLGIFPRDAEVNSERRQKIREINGIVKAKYKSVKKVFFMDIGDQLTRADGTIDKEIMYDYLHLTDNGYAVWARAIGPTLKKLVDNDI